MSKQLADKKSTPSGAAIPRETTTSSLCSKPQTLAGIEVTQRLNYTASATNDNTTETTLTTDASRMEGTAMCIGRNRARLRASCTKRDEREHSCDGIVGSFIRPGGVGGLGVGLAIGGDDENISLTGRDEVLGANRRCSASGTSNAVDEFSSINVAPRRESLNFEDTSPSAANFAKSLRSLRYPVGAAGATTRKCVLTLDGYSYVIVASTPENLSKRDEPTGIGSGCGTTISGAATFSANATTPTSADPSLSERLKANSPPGSAAVSLNSPNATDTGTTTSDAIAASNQNAASINGQVARHGSLTIVRRSNSRKSFTQTGDPQQTSAATTPSACSTNAVTFPTQLSVSQATATTTGTQYLATPVLDEHSSSIQTTTGTINTTTATSSTSIASYENRSIEALKAEALDNNNAQAFSSQQAQQQATIASKFANQDLKSTTSPTTNMQPTSPNATNFIPATSGLSSSSNDSLQDATPSAITLDLATENLPAVDTPDACDKAALRLRHLLRLLNNGDVSSEVLRKNLHYAARVLEAVFIDESKRLADEDDELSEVQPDAVPPEVREWLASTFTRQLATTRRRTDEKPKFRSVAHAIRAGIFVDRIYRRVSSTALMQFPPEVVKVLKTLDDWSFDVFALADAANGQPVKYIGYDLLNRYGIIHKFKIAPATLETFLHRIEEGYCRFRNPYHNNLHAADVTQTVHHMLCQTGLMNWLTDLEIYATLLAALIHDYEHTGTTNNFHVMSGSDTALLYNDRAVLENHHVSAAFRLLKDDDCNILSNLSREEFRELRTLIIDMVLSTDMSFHFQQLKNMKNLLTLNEATVDKSKALALVLHCCDISHPAKRWNLHHRWTMLLLEEFFRQGDLERELGLPFSPLCDRNNTLVAESQIGFIDFIVDPSMSVMADMLEYVLLPIAPMCKNVNASIDVADSAAEASSGPGSSNRGNIANPCTTIQESSEDCSNSPPKCVATDDSGKHKFTIRKPWILFLTENKKIWKEQAVKDAEARAAAIALEEVKSKGNEGDDV